MIRNRCEEKGTLKHLEQGIRGLADLIRPLIEAGGKPMFVLSDASRSSLKYIKSGEIETDSNANMLVQKIQDNATPSFNQLFRDNIKDASEDEAGTLTKNLRTIKRLDDDKNKKKLIKELHIPSKKQLSGEDTKEEEKEEEKGEEKKEKKDKKKKRRDGAMEDDGTEDDTDTDGSDSDIDTDTDDDVKEYKGEF
jgi:hypothetical protein